MDIHFPSKNENESHLIILVFFFFFIYSVTKSALQCAATTSSSFAFFAGGLCWRDSSFLMYWVKAIFHNLCTVLYWRLCGLTNSPIVKYLSTEADVHGAQKVLSNNGFRMANCFCCLSQNVMVCLAHCRQEWQQKSRKTGRLSSRPRPRPNVKDQDQDFMIQDQD